MSYAESGETRVTVIGNWEVSASTVITEDGAYPATSITDGTETLVTTEPPDQLMVALAQHLGVASWSAET
jgi:hypothetical protein